MRLVVLLDRWRRGGGGLEAYLEQVLPALAGRHEVLLVARDAEHDPPRAVRACPAGSRLPLPRPLRDLADARALAQAASALQPDRVLGLRAVPFPHALWQPHGGSAPHLRLARLGARPPGWRARLLERLEQRTLDSCRGALALSPRVARQLRGRRPNLPVSLLPPPLPAGVPAPAGTPQEPPRVLFCGRDARLKGAPDALRVFRALQPRLPGAELVLWARSRAHLQRVLGLRPRQLAAEGVELRPWDGTFRSALQGAALLLHPTRYDACSLVCLEAAAAGVPVLTSIENGLVELLGEPLVAALHSWEPQAAARAALGLLDRRREDAAAWLHAAAKVREEFSLARHVEELERALEQGPT